MIALNVLQNIRHSGLNLLSSYKDLKRENGNGLKHCCCIKNTVTLYKKKKRFLGVSITNPTGFVKPVS